MILIPGVCALVIAARRTSRPAIDVERDVVWRDGLFFLVCEALLLICLFQDTMHWWMGAAFVGLYALYILKLQRDAGAYRRHYETVKQAFEQMGRDVPSKDVARALAEDGTRVDRATVARVKHALHQGRRSGDSDDEQEPAGSARVFFRCCRVPLNRVSVWVILGAATGLAAFACYFLVETVYATADELNVAPFFVAVILAAAASSLPDMFLSIGAARRGDDSGAISNAFGSNIFDICICLSLPLLLASFLNGWQPISLLQDGKPMAGLVGLRMLLWVLTLVTLVIIWHKRRVTRTKGLILCALYCVFIAYAVLGSLNVSIFGYSL
jgi:cation:H+ antiporter